MKYQQGNLSLTRTTFSIIKKNYNGENSTIFLKWINKTKCKGVIKLVDAEEFGHHEELPFENMLHNMTSCDTSICPYVTFQFGYKYSLP